jgi:integrase
MANVLNRLILPVLNRCAICKLPKGRRHAGVDHDWKEDDSVPRWRGWHAFRRSVATNLQHLGANVTTAQGALRHSDATVTLRHYYKVVRDDVRAIMERFGDSVELNSKSVEDTHGTSNQPCASQPGRVN